MIFFCNLPFVFFAGKVALLAVVHECLYKKGASEEEKEEDYPLPSTENDDHFGAAEGLITSNSDDKVSSDSNYNMSPQKLRALEDSEAATSFVSDQSKKQVEDRKPEDVLPTWVYLLTCFTYLLLVALAAIFIDDLTLIFGIIAGLAECTTVFIFPSIFYLIACQRQAKEQQNINNNKSC